MTNPDSIEIHGEKTIVKLCKFAVEHNMEGSTFTEILERLFSEYQKAEISLPKDPGNGPTHSSKACLDVMNERNRQINNEHFSTEEDDNYEQNELLRASISYSTHALSRGWVYSSNLGPQDYQSEEAPDLWGFDLDSWKPKNPRQDLVRAAALLVAEIERIDRNAEKMKSSDNP